MSNAKDWREVKAHAALRHRIAATILEYHEAWGGGLCLCGRYHEGTAEHMADAVIAELGLHIQRQSGDIVNVIEGDDINYARHRWVTDWKADDES